MTKQLSEDFEVELEKRVLRALDDVTEEFAPNSRVKGWIDADLKTFRPGIRAHAKTLRERIEQKMSLQPTDFIQSLDQAVMKSIDRYRESQVVALDIQQQNEDRARRAEKHRLLKFRHRQSTLNDELYDICRYAFLGQIHSGDVVVGKKYCDNSEHHVIVCEADVHNVLFTAYPDGDSAYYTIVDPEKPEKASSYVKHDKESFLQQVAIMSVNWETERRNRNMKKITE